MFRSHGEATYHALKAATRAVYDILGGQKVAASKARVHETAVSEYGRTNYPERFAPIDVALDWDAEAIKASGSPIILAEMARQLGYRLVPTEAGESHRDIVHSVLDVLAKTGDISRAVSEMDQDGRRDPHEWREIETRITAARIALRQAADIAARHLTKTGTEAA
jgi:hypothetical protein